MKKLLSVFLSLLMILSLAVVSLAGEYDEKPTVYVIGARVLDIYAKDGTKIFPKDSDAGAVIKDALKPCLEKLAKGMLLNDYKPWAEEFHKAVIEVLGELALDGNGEVTDGSHVAHPYNYALPEKSSDYGTEDYLLWYDWRVSPLETAELLKKYIDDVKEVTKEDKVNIIGRCYGANVVQAYLTLYPEHAVANVDDVAYLSSSVSGIDGLGALFSADIELDDQAIENFVEYYMQNGDLIEDPDTRELIEATVEILNYISVLGLTGDACEMFIEVVKDDIFPLVLKDTFAGWPSYWAMVPAEKYIEARDFIFQGAEDEYKGFIEKCDRYYYEVQLKAEETLKSLESQGIDFYIISKYNFPDFPAYEGATALSDGFTLVERQSFGATCSEHKGILSDSYVSSLKDTRYLSPDRKIDASTCLFPETSYFIKNLHHETFPPAINDLAFNLMNNEATVSGGEYAQYYLYEGQTQMNPVEGLDEDGLAAKEPVYMRFIRFMAAFMKLVAKLLKGEISLGA